MSDLEHILSDEPIVTEEPEQEEPETSEVEPAEEETPEPQVEEPQEEPKMVPLAALESVRSEMKAMKAQMAQPPQQAEPMPKAPEPLDPEFANHMQMQMQQMQANFSADLSEAKARATYEHVDDAFAAAQEAGVLGQFKGGQDPWGRLVNWHRGVQEQAKAQDILAKTGGDLDAYTAKIKADALKEFQAQQVAESVTQVGKAPSLAGEANLGSRAAPEWSGPLSLEEILSG